MTHTLVEATTHALPDDSRQTEQHRGEPASPGTCRFCGALLHQTFADLGMSPPGKRYLRADQVEAMESFYPLHVYVCERCFLVQLQAHGTRERSSGEYAHFSSSAETWLALARAYTDRMVEELRLTAKSRVVELASNDGYLLQYFVERGIPSLGIEPAANVAAVAIEKGIPTLVESFGRATATDLVGRGETADLLIANNVLPQVSDLNDFVAGMKILLTPRGVATLEVPHLVRVIAENQFDTICHEHLSYFSLFSIEQILAAHGLSVYDVDEIDTHGGSLRIFACHSEDPLRPVTPRVDGLRARERAAGLSGLAYYAQFGERVRETKRKLLQFLIAAKRAGKTVAAYGAPGEANTLLNHCGIRTDFVDYTVDGDAHKHGKFLPGTHIPIHAPDRLRETHPDYVLILPWSLKQEIMDRLAYVRDWGGQFVIPIPEVQIIP